MVKMDDLLMINSDHLLQQSHHLSVLPRFLLVLFYSSN